MVRVELPDPPPTELGLKLPLARDGKPETLNFTVPVKPLAGAMVTV
jgi:hypothetical protein